jgi:hypothetical protein
MGKPPTFIEKFESPNLDLDAEAEKHGAPRAATTAIYAAVIIALVLLFVCLAIGHVPRGG